MVIDRDILDAVPCYVFWKNTNSVFEGCNLLFAQLAGLKSSQEIIGKTDYDLPWTDEESDSYIADDRKVILSGKPHLNIEEKQTLPNGKEIYLLTNKVPRYDREGKIVGVIGVFQDISPLKIAKEKAEVSNKAKSEFIANMEHDIRTPFVGVLGMAQYLVEIEQDVKKREYLSDIAQCARELLNYCNDIFEYSKLESNRVVITDKKFTLRSMVEGIIKVETPAAKNKQLSLQLLYDDSIPEQIIGDSYRLYRILLNLVSNAIKFTSTGSVQLQVALTHKNKKEVLIMFCIKDTGIGIPEEKQEYIFEKFSRLSLANRGVYKGIGLGLYVVKQFIHEMNGEIDLISQKDVGTEISCAIPFKIPLEEHFKNP